MVALSRKQMLVFLLVLVSFLVALVTSMAIIHAVNPTLWHHVLDMGPDTWSHF
jgi:hypothetical protein